MQLEYVQNKTTYDLCISYAKIKILQYPINRLKRSGFKYV